MQQDDTTVRNAAMAREVLACHIDTSWSGTLPISSPGGQEVIVRAMIAFAALSPADGAGGAIRAAVIEECARIAENGWQPAYVTNITGEWEPGSPWDRGAVDACKRIAAAIRALAPTETGEAGK
jgi:hypothetical protein